jgi:hypothetical protein
VARQDRQEVKGQLARILAVDSIGRKAITFMLNASLRNVSIREILVSPAESGEVVNQSTTTA